MQLKSIFLAAAMVVAGASASAATQSQFGSAAVGTGSGDLTFSLTGTNIVSGFLLSSGVFSGADLTFTNVSFGGTALSNDGAGTSWSFAPTTLGAGNYHLTFDYTNNDAASVAYMGKISYTPGTVAAVPEPETYAMMLAGLGALGFVGRRRKAQAK